MIFTPSSSDEGGEAMLLYKILRPTEILPAFFLEEFSDGD
jgi:hypothetical protein